MTTKDHYSVFIADDDKDDQMFICSAFEELGIDLALKTFENGKLLLDYLATHHKEQKARSQADVVLLDLNMPVLDGIQTLRRMRSSKELDKMPIVILSTSNRDKDIDAAYESKANGYICKPLKCNDYVVIADTLIKFIGGASPLKNPAMVKFLRKDLYPVKM